MALYRYSTTATGRTGTPVQWFSDSAGTTAALISPTPDGAAIAPISPQTTNSATGAIATVYGNAATVYVREVDLGGNPVGSVITSIAGVSVVVPPSSGGGSGGGSGVDQTARDAATAAQVQAATNAAALLATAPALPLLATVTQSTALTKGSTLPTNATAGIITHTALPALTSLNLGDTYGVQKTDTSANTVTIPFTSGDTTLSGSTSAVLSMPGTVSLRVVANPAGGRIWQSVAHTRSDSAIIAAITAAVLAGLSQNTSAAVYVDWDATLNSGSGGYAKRSNYTNNPKQHLTYVGPVSPTSGGDGSISGVDFYLTTV